MAKAEFLIVVVAVLLFAGVARAHEREAADSLARELQEVVVTARQPATKLVGSTLVSTIPGSNLAVLGNALDVLAQLPMITVDENTVSVIGKSDVEIFIDGRPMRDDTELQQILSSDLRTVELNMAPGAAYGSTTGAVLKITTRRNFVRGLSVTDQFRLQRRRKWSVTDFLGLSFRTGGWELFAEGSVNHSNLLINGTTVNALIYDGKATVAGSTQHTSNPATTGVVKAGFSHVGGPQSFGAYYRYNPERGDFSNAGTEWLDGNQPLNREISRRIRAHSHLVSLYYENRFSDRFLVHFDGDFRQSDADSRVATVYSESVGDDVNSADNRMSTLWAGRLYVDCALWGGDFSAGTRGSHTRTSLDYRMLNAQVGEYIPSSLTDAGQTTAALFASWSRTFGRFSLTAGARYEYVDYSFSVDGRRDADVSRRDHLLTPDVSAGYSFDEESQISLSYKMATVRPPYSQLTGSLSYVGRHEIEGGNPALRDERMHDLQLFGTWRGFMLQVDFTRSIDTYAFVKQLYPAPDLQLLMRPVNIDVSALNLYLVWSRPVGRWAPNVTVGMYRQWLRLSDSRHDSPIFSYYFDNTLSLPHGWMLTANVSGSSGGDMHTNRFGAGWFTMDASVGKTFRNRSLTVKLTATDIFNTANSDWTMNTCGVFVDKRQSYDRRGVSLSMIYNFRSRKSRYKGSAAAETEMNRL